MTTPTRPPTTGAPYLLTHPSLTDGPIQHDAHLMCPLRHGHTRHLRLRTRTNNLRLPRNEFWPHRHSPTLCISSSAPYRPRQPHSPPSPSAVPFFRPRHSSTPTCHYPYFAPPRQFIAAALRHSPDAPEYELPHARHLPNAPKLPIYQPPPMLDVLQTKTSHRAIVSIRLGVPSRLNRHNLFRFPTWPKSPFSLEPLIVSIRQLTSLKLLVELSRPPHLSEPLALAHDDRLTA